MPKRLDATLKDLASIDPASFLAELDRQLTLPVCLLNVDLSTVTAATDMVFGLGEPLQGIIHVDAQSGPDAGKHLDLLAYHALLHRQYRVPVHSILLLLRREAQLTVQSGNIQYSARPGRGKMDVGYEVIRLWEHPVESVLAGGTNLLPLAPLCRLPDGMSFEEGMRWAIAQATERLRQQRDPELRPRLLTAMLILSGLRVNREQAQAIFRGVLGMHESDTYQAIIDEGQVKGVQRFLLRLARQRLGEPDERTRCVFESIVALDRLDRLGDQLQHVSTWQELLAIP